MPQNTQAIDFECPSCSAVFQLKAGQRWNERKIPDAGYKAMMLALLSDSAPNLLVMQYTADWCVQNLLLVPSFFFTPATIEKRKPLGIAARRAGWVGCNILLSEVADIGKIKLVANGESVDIYEVRKQYSNVRPLANLSVEVRGWTLDVLHKIRTFGKKHFTIDDAYAFDVELSKLHPKNQNVRPKIRQQLQVLRKLGFVEFLGGGKYKLL